MMTAEEKQFYYLRIEGVNLDNFVYDTNDLSTIRGGGLLLLQAPDWIDGQLRSDGVVLETVTKGASLGVYRFAADSDLKAGEMAADVLEKLSRDENYRHATFTVEVLPAGNDYTTTRDKLAALSRWRQMSTLSITYPDKVPEPVVSGISANKKTGNVHVCRFDHVRPAATLEAKGDEKLPASLSVSKRRNFGKDQKKRQWYQNQTGLKDLPHFTNYLKELTTADNGRDVGLLNQKMAVIYLDGNGFGKLQQKYCTSRKDQKRFDQIIRQEFQNGTLAALLKEIKTDPDWLNEGKIRLETLLWGGDEVIWVVPAWKGWWMLGRFFKDVRDKWEYPKGSKLTLSAGLIFCRHKAPIQRIVHLCKALGDHAKGDRSLSRVAYQVLESFDHAGTDLEAFRRLRCPYAITPEKLLIDGNSMLAIVESVKKLKEKIPKRKLHRLVESLYDRSSSESAEELRKEIEANCHIETLYECLGSGDELWLHLLELWDYIAPESFKKGE